MARANPSMIARRLLVTLGLLLALVGCGGDSADPQPTNPPGELPPPGISTQAPPNPEGTATTFLEAWQNHNYEGMYSLLSPLSQDAISLADFTDFYTKTELEATVTEISTNIQQALSDGLSAEVKYSVTLKTLLVGNVQRDTVMTLTFEQGRWGINWARSLFLPELETDNALFMAFKKPARGNIYDRNGLALAAQADAVAIGIVPGEVDPETEGDMLHEVSLLIDRHPESIRAMYQFQQADWYVPIGVASTEAVQARFNKLAQFAGLRLNTFPTRFYNGAYYGAPHAVGYTAFIQPDYIEEYRRQGYPEDARIGALGIELWGEEMLAGKPGGTLYVISSDGEIISTLGDGASAPAQSITTTLDRSFQHEVQAALQDMPGAIVVLNYNTGEVLALASGPGFDPNLFEPSNPNASQLVDMLSNPDSPLINRATQGQYPPGSTFKVVTAAAALESTIYTADTTMYCGYEWTGLGADLPLYDWTFDREDEPPSGTLNLTGALMRSCNPWFYQIGLDLYNWDPFFLPEIAKSFGFGSEPTGIVGLSADNNEEVGGIVPDKAWIEANSGIWQAGHSVNTAIGQGDLLVTPLQLAVAYAAIANGGTRYRPQMILSVAGPDEDPAYTFEPEVTGNLNLSEGTLDVIYDGMWNVANHPDGTARPSLIGIGIPVYGKTGTAEDPPFKPHSWFAGFTRAEQADKPDIAVVVLVENRGEGSVWAAPIFRRVVESYFYGQPRVLYPWEAEIGLTATPTVEGEEDNGEGEGEQSDNGQ